MTRRASAGPSLAAPRPGLLPRRPIVTRLVVSVAAAMAVVLLLAAGFVFWRVQFALNRQLDQDLRAWASVVDRAVTQGATPPTQTPGFAYQVYDASGRLAQGSPGLRPLASAGRLGRFAAGDVDDYDVGTLLHPGDPVYRVRPTPVHSRGRELVVLAVVSRSKHDEALRELLLQLGIGNLLALVAASFVGYRTARAALNPVEAYRRAAQQTRVDSGERLPVDDDRDDELTRLGHTLNDLLERIDASAARERQFLADAAHELRTPLTLMSAELEWVAHRRRTPEQTSEALDSLRGQVERLSRLANVLLEVEELRARDSLDRRPVDVLELVDDAVHDTLPRSAEVRVAVHGPDGDPPPVSVDRRWVGIALANLLRNAERHGRPPIEVDATLGHGSLELVVRDHGPGFPADFRAVAFDRFSRSEQSRSTPGTGLGLHLVESVATAHGGHAEILDGPGAAVRLVLDTTGSPDQRRSGRVEEPEDLRQRDQDHPGPDEHHRGPGVRTAP